MFPGAAAGRIAILPSLLPAIDPANTAFELSFKLTDDPVGMPSPIEVPRVLAAVALAPRTSPVAQFSAAKPLSICTAYNLAVPPVPQAAAAAALGVKVVKKTTWLKMSGGATTFSVDASWTYQP